MYSFFNYFVLSMIVVAVLILPLGWMVWLMLVLLARMYCSSNVVGVLQ